MIDNLSYTYAGTTSLLSSVSDATQNPRGFKGAASTYGYDPTGNLISDSQKGIADIAYTYNDLPIKITSANGTIENFYTSAGEKLKSIITPTNQELNAGPVGLATGINHSPQSRFSVDKRFRAVSFCDLWRQKSVN